MSVQLPQGCEGESSAAAAGLFPQAAYTLYPAVCAVVNEDAPAPNVDMLVFAVGQFVNTRAIDDAWVLLSGGGQ